MSEYIFARIKKDEMLSDLIKSDSCFASLYKSSYPSEQTAFEMWSAFCSDNFNNKVSESAKYSISKLEAKAIINWLYHSHSDALKREEATKQILSLLGNEYDICTLSFAHGFIFDKSKIAINFITSFDSFIKALKDMSKPQYTSFYRGHSDANYTLLPSVMRKNSWIEHECDLYNETIIECPTDFEKCKTHLDYLVEMQHYGLPTRLLDVTRNPLVALYFACVESPSKQGELIVFNVEQKQVKYPKSDTVSILASLPLFKYESQKTLCKLANDTSVTQNSFNSKAVRLLHEVKLEKPAFRDEIKKEDIVSCFFVQAEKRNERIIKQDGAFLICGLIDDKKNVINQYRYKQKDIIQIYIIEKNSKEGIKKQLEKLSINKAQLFPEIQDVTSHIKSKY